MGETAGNPSAAGAARDESTLADARASFQWLVRTIWRLRQPDGCPWDREQTHASIAGNMIEEAYEAVDCIESGDAAHLREELGDVLMQVVLHAQIAADAGEFTIDDVVRDLDEKLVRRHPHVFGSAEGARDADAVLDIWDEVKRAEREGRNAAEDGAASTDGADAEPAPEGLLDSVPLAFPALMQAQKVSKRAAKAGFEWDTVEDVWDQVASERAEFEAEEPGSDARSLEFGDMLFALVNVARKEGHRRRGRPARLHSQVPPPVGGHGGHRARTRRAARGPLHLRAQRAVGRRQGRGVTGPRVLLPGARPRARGGRRRLAVRSR